MRELTRLRGLLVAPIVAFACALAAAGAADAEVCAGSNGRPCPYLSVQVIGQRAEGVLRFPEAVAVDAQGDVYVADQLSYVVQKFNAAGAFVGEWGSYGGGHGQFGPIGGLAVDAAGDVYVVDSANNRIQKFTPGGGFIASWGGSGHALGHFRFGSSTNPSQPPGGGIAVAGNFVYVADSANNRIERFNLAGGEAMQWGSSGSNAGQFSNPRGLAANGSEVLVADDANHRIQKFDPNGVWQGAVGALGTGPGQFDHPFGVALDAAANVYVADNSNHRVVKLTPQLAFAGAWGGPGSKPGQLTFPRAIAADAAGDSYVADSGNGRVEVFNPAGALLRTIGVSAQAGGLLTAPRGLAPDPTGTLLVSDTIGGRIERFAPAGGAFAGEWTQAGGLRPGFSIPAGIAVDPRGSVWLADPGNERVARLWGDGTFLSELGGPAVIGGSPMSAPAGVAVTAGPDETYVADSGHNRILVYGPAGQPLARWGTAGGNGAPGKGPGEYNRPLGVGVDPAANVYVADTGNNRVVVLNSAGGVLGAWGGYGTADGRFIAPTAVAVDAAGRVYVLDSGNNRVQVFDGRGHLLTMWGVRGVGAGAFSQPHAIAVDCAGDVYVADTNNNRVERFHLVSPAATGCLAPGAWPPPLDVPPVVHVSLVRGSAVLSRRSLVLAVSCVRGCRVLVTATLKPLFGRGRAQRLGAGSRALRPQRAGLVRLPVGRIALRRLRAELGRHTAMIAHVTVLAAGPTGRRTTVTADFRVRR
jgi:DNA-binding beta-propeller fold protein YncE